MKASEENLIEEKLPILHLSASKQECLKGVPPLLSTRKAEVNHWRQVRTLSAQRKQQNKST